MASPPVRVALIVCGSLATALGFVGVLLPVLPTTPFLLIAAYCYARSSQRLYDWLLRTRGFGPLIRQYREHRVIPTRAKVAAVAMIALAIGTSVVFSVPYVPAKVVLVGIGLIVAVWLALHPSSYEPPPDSPGD